MTLEELLQAAEEYNLQYEISQCLEAGMSPDQAAREWDL